MKTALIVMLTLALTAAAFLTRPDRRDLMFHVLDSQAGSSWTKEDLREAESLVRSVTFHNRILWTDVEKDGKVLYTGAFSHWVPRSPAAQPPLPSAAQLADLARLIEP